MGLSRRSQELATKILAVAADPSLSRKAAARLLSELPPADATELLHELMVRAREGSSEALHALQHLASALTWEGEELPKPALLHRLACVQDLEDVALLFETPPAKQVFDARTAAKKEAQAFPESLGHRKTLARLTKDKDELVRLAGSQEPSVVQCALLNPRMTVALAVRIAARRPSRPEPLLEVWKNPRWGLLPDVRRALAFNPYFPPEVAAKIVPLLGKGDLQHVAQDKSLPEALRRQAQVLLEEPREKSPAGSRLPPSEA